MTEPVRDRQASGASNAVGTGLSEEAFTRMREQLRRAVSRACPGSLADRRDDIIQVALARMLDISRRNEDRTAFPASYLWKAAFSATIDEIRRLQREQARTADVEDTASLSDPVRPSPERQVAGREIGEHIRSCIRGLPRPRRMAVVLYLQGESASEASQLLGWNAKKVSNLTYRGLADLRVCLRSKGVDP